MWNRGGCYKGKRILFMSKKGPNQPPYTLTPAILRLVAEISEVIGRLSAQAWGSVDP